MRTSWISTRVPRRRTAAAVATAGALACGALAAGPAAAAGPSAGGATIVSLSPSDDTGTVPDERQLTGRRVNLPTDVCTTDKVTLCGLAQRLNELDGFDLDPRIALHFSGPVSVDDVLHSTTVRPMGGGQPVYVLDRAVYDPATYTVYAHPRHQLQPGTTYQLKVGRERGLGVKQTLFTTESATDGLLDMRKQLDDGSAYAAAGIAAAQRGLQVDAVVPADGTTFTYTQDQGTVGGLVPVPLPNAVHGTVVLGSYLAPSWLRPDGTIEQTPTKDTGPAPVGAARLPFALVLPPGPVPAGGWPTAVFGHGFTGADSNVLLAAATNSVSGVATLSTDVVGHGYGPRSTWTYTHGSTTRTVPAYARGIDRDGNGVITSTEGSSTLPTGPAAAVGSRDALRQTSADVMTLVRAIGLGADVDGQSGVDLRPTGVSYFGQSFGGIYGTMVTGADPTLLRSVLNVPGGPINEIVRLSPAFRLLETQALQIAGLLNSADPARDFFQEDLPLAFGPPVLDPVPGALAIQAYLADSTWLDRSGSPETFAPLIDPAKVVLQSAYGDQTVPNPTAYTLLDAGNLFGRDSLYRNDKTVNRDKNPHGFLLDLAGFPVASLQAQAQVLSFLRDGQVIDPDGPGRVWEVPIRWKAALRTLNFDNPAFPQQSAPAPQQAPGQQG